jgi:hypothetical protein
MGALSDAAKVLGTCPHNKTAFKAMVVKKGRISKVECGRKGSWEVGGFMRAVLLGC